MPRSKNPDAYSPGCHHAFAQATLAPYSITVPTKEVAHSLRFELYGYRRALEHVGDAEFAAFAKVKVKIMPVLSSTEYEVVLESVVDDPVTDLLMSGQHLSTPRESTALPTAIPEFEEQPSFPIPVVGSAPVSEETESHADTLAGFGYSSGIEEEK